MSELTPAMQQYVDLKKQYSDCILFFRLGDFYEVFWDDAHLCHRLLDIVITSRNKNAENPIPMAGMPYHSIDKYITRLINLGYKVAIAEQTTEPKPGQVIERTVTQVISPGTYVEENTRNFSYLLSITATAFSGQSHFHCARGDFSLGERTTESFEHLEDLQKKILTLSPSEIILDINFPDKESIHTTVQRYTHCFVSICDIPHAPEDFLRQVCRVQTLQSYGKAVQDGREFALALLFHYLIKTQQTTSLAIIRIGYDSAQDYVLLDATSIKNLEIFTASYEGGETYSICSVLDTTITTTGARMFKYILTHPLKQEPAIQERLNHISYYQATISKAKQIHTLLGDTYDCMKLLSSIIYKKPLPVLFAKLRKTLSLVSTDALPISDELLRLGLAIETKEDITHLAEILHTIFVADDELTNNEEGFIRTGYDTAIDTLREIAFHADDLLVAYQQELVQETSIASIKIKYITNQGYFIEATNKDIEKFDAAIEKLQHSSLPENKRRIIRRQTLKGAQRYVSAYLDTIQTKVLQAKADLIRREQEILTETQKYLSQQTNQLAMLGDHLAMLDIYTSHALFAKEKNLTKPTFVRGEEITITNGRHLVIESFLPKEDHFIPNNLSIGTTETNGTIHIITGPNMGGKSTFLRQNALIVLLAHCGLFVPATEAKISIVDGIFARVGSGDVIAKNQSTFMTEMIEVANILHNATAKSFVIFDELGRGTSTYDGLALTQAILAYIATTTKCKTLIATHYHELITMEEAFSCIKNFSVSVYETNKDVVFLKKIVAGGADKSYGIDVAKLAGIPAPILEAAKKNLEVLHSCLPATERSGLEGLSPSNEISHAIGNGTSHAMLEQTSHAMNRVSTLFQPTPIPQQKNATEEKLISLIKSYNLNTMTPLQAFQILMKLQEEVK